MTIDTEFSLQGKKVLLRRFDESDIDETYIAWLNDPAVVRFSNQRFLKHDSESCLRHLASFEGTENLFINIYSLADERSVGTMTVYVSRYHGTAAVGIMIGDKSVWGSGYGQDAWNTMISWLFENYNIRKLSAGTPACNPGMIKIMERSGMHHEATQKAQHIINGEAVDIIFYAKFHDETIQNE